MTWRKWDVAEQRLEFVRASQTQLESHQRLCDSFGISRKTGYKWLERYHKHGAPGLTDRSHTAHRRPHSVSQRVVEKLVEARLKHPTWGPRKLVAWLTAKSPQLVMPAASTVGELLKRLGLVKARRPRREHPEPRSTPVSDYSAPNTVWCADFKGHFPLADGRRVHPLTITDGFSRFLLCCHALVGPTTDLSRPVFERVFRQFGLPHALRSDNGSPFSSTALAGLSALAIWWLKLGIRLERNAPSRPDHNGRHERMHRTLKAEATKPPASSFAAQQRRLDEWRREYNDERPHQALDMRTPASVYLPSPRQLPRRLPAAEYPIGYEIRRIRSSGDLKWRSEKHFVSEALVGETVGLHQVSDGLWVAYFGTLRIGVLDEHDDRFNPNLDAYDLPD